MGWDTVDAGFKIVLGPEVPTLAEQYVPTLVDALLEEHGLKRCDVHAWLAHPGGPAVMKAMERGLGLADEALERTRRSLATVGNLSSASVLFILHDYLREYRASEPRPAVMLAMGPGFCAEAVLLQ
jgi:alkylresorcinol/alkylpyrone synthase